jgi:uncharacterized OB-fold protein
MTFSPTPDQESVFYWDGLRQHRLLVQQCASCRAYRFPPMPSCPACGHLGATVVEVSGEGTVYSWIRVHRAFSEALAAEVPYSIAVVELDEGCRLVGRLEVDGPAAPGDRVNATFTDHDSWTELRFRPPVRVMP